MVTGVVKLPPATATRYGDLEHKLPSILLAVAGAVSSLHIVLTQSQPTVCSESLEKIKADIKCSAQLLVVRRVALYLLCMTTFNVQLEGLMGDDGRFGKVCSDPKLNTIYFLPYIYMKRDTSFAPMEIFVVCDAVAPAAIRCYRSAKNTIIKTHYFPFE